MSKYINADEYAKKLDLAWEDYFRLQKSTEGIDTAISIFEDMPYADVVEVVRCKDCKYFYNSVSICNLPSGISYATPKSFCSYGERKETK